MPAPAGIMTFYGDALSSIPAGWSNPFTHANYANNFIKGSAIGHNWEAGGSATLAHSHSMSHVHTGAHQHDITMTSIGTNVELGGALSVASGSGFTGHTHSLSPEQTTSLNVTGASTTNDVDIVDQGVPKHVTLSVIESDGTTDFPTSSIFLWRESDTLPAGTSAYTNGEGDRYIRLPPESTDPGTQVAGDGAHQHGTTHDHPDYASHSHDISATTTGVPNDTLSNANNIGGTTRAFGSSTHTHAVAGGTTGSVTHNINGRTINTSSVEVLPPFSVVRAFKLNSPTDVLPVGSIAMLTYSSPSVPPPDGWWEVEELQEVYPQIRSSGVGTTGGQLVYSHTLNHGHTLSSFSGSHTGLSVTDTTSTVTATQDTGSTPSGHYTGSVQHELSFQGGSVPSVDLELGPHLEPRHRNIYFIRWSVVNYTQATSGTLGAFTGSVVKNAWKVLAGVAGAITGTKTYSEVQKITLTGQLQFTANVLNMFITSTQTGVITMVGQANHLQQIVLTGTLGVFSGTKTYIEVFLVDIAGTLGNISGTLGNFSIFKAVGHSLNFAGILYLETAIKVLENLTGGYMVIGNNVTNKISSAGRSIIRKIKGGKVTIDE